MTVPSSARVELTEAHFSRDWPKHPCADHVGEALRGCRVVGVVSAKVDGVPRQGLLLRHIKTKSYRLAGDFPVVELPTDPTDHFLESLRAGHHGGPGRCQGRRAVDGRSYPKRCHVLLPTDMILTLSSVGDGNVSLGLRRLAERLSARADGAGGDSVSLDVLLPAYDPRSSLSDDCTRSRVRLFVARHQLPFLRALGGGNLSAGIRACVWAAQHGPLAS